MADKEKIIEVLQELDPLDDDQWTNDGAPKVEVVGKLAGDFGIKRQDILNAAPSFSRENPTTEIENDEGDGDTETDTEGEGDDTDTEGEGNGDDTDPEAGDDDEGEGDPEPEIDDEPEEVSVNSDAEFDKWLASVKPQHLEQTEQDLSEQLAECNRDIEEAKARHARIKRARNLTRVRIKQLVPNTSNQESIKTFIKSQTATRAGRVARRNEVLKGIKPEELDPRAPIDRAMARKNKRGSGRPQRPLMK